MPVLVLAVLGVVAVAGHLLVAVPHPLIFHIDIVAVLVAEGQRIVVVLAEVHQSIHILGREPVLQHRLALAVQHPGAVGIDAVVGPQTSQHLLARRKGGASGGQDHQHSLLLRLPQCPDHPGTDAGLSRHHQSAVDVQQ